MQNVNNAVSKEKVRFNDRILSIILLFNGYHHGYYVDLTITFAMVENY